MLKIIQTLVSYAQSLPTTTPAAKSTMTKTLYFIMKIYFVPLNKKVTSPENGLFIGLEGVSV